MLGQVTLAQHSATHIEHGFPQEIMASHDDHDDHHHDHGEDNEPHECPECLLTKSLQTAFYNAPIALSIIISVRAITLPKQSHIVSSSRYKSNAPRAPPFILT